MIDLDEVAAEYVATPVVPPTRVSIIIARGQKIRSRRRRLMAVAVAFVSLSIAIPLEIIRTHRQSDVQVFTPSQPNATTPRTMTPRETVPRATPSPKRIGDTAILPLPRWADNGPVAQRLETLGKPLIPQGSNLIVSQDSVSGSPEVGEVDYVLPNGQRVHLVMELLPAPLRGWDESAVQDRFAADSIVRLPTGSWLVRVANVPGELQVMLLRPHGMFVNVQVTTPWDPKRPGQGPIPDPAIRPAWTLPSLTAAVQQAFDRPATDAP